MALQKNYNPLEVEKKWYEQWQKDKVFASKVNKNKEAYTVVIPPPNVTGVLHMGHMLNNTVQDILIRRARMMGKEACWVPGTDHASIATESKVVKLLAEKGISKDDISRDEFLNHALDWKDKYGGIILKQLKRLGASCDWDRTAFTMDEEYSKSVIDVFVDLYKKGYIYRGVRMVNWDPKGKTALSDEEVIHKEVQSQLYYIKYPISGEDGHLIVATTRPETLLGDTAICINPNDDRYKSLHGKKAIVPIVNREIPIICDEYVDLDFGTGCLKVTPAHDLNDYELGLKHKLESIDILSDDGTLNENAGHYIGEDRFDVRKKIIKDLKAIDLFEKVEQINNSIGFSERTDAVIEPKLSTQWFCKMEEMAKPALENVMNDNIAVFPSKFKNMYRSWMDNVKDWCISRQLWWGHRIPAYYLPNGEFVIASTPEEALEEAKKMDSSITMDELRQDEDVLDTWFSSWLWPISLFNGLQNPDNEEFKFYYPTATLVTGFDIIFFWVARMIMAGYEYTGTFPFKDVYFTGMVRDEKGKKMSKSLGNSPDPIDLIDEYGADGVRVGMLLTAPAGNDLLFNEKLCEQGKNFTNKLWNAYRLVENWEVSEDGENNEIAVHWIKHRIAETLEKLEDDFAKYRLSDALMSVYKLVWDDFCSWYLEMIKPEYGKPIHPQVLSETKEVYQSLLKVLHPFTPFITEELWSNLRSQEDSKYIATASWPVSTSYDQGLLGEVSYIKEVVSSLRNFRNEKNLSPKEALNLQVKTDNFEIYASYSEIIKKLANLKEVSQVSDKSGNCFTLVIKADELFIPAIDNVDTAKEKEKLTEELQYMEGFLKGVDKKLANERFVNNAPEEVVQNEQKKKADAEAKIAVLKQTLESLV